MFNPSQTEPAKPKPSLIQLKVALQEVEDCLNAVEETIASLEYRQREISRRCDNLRALILEQS